MQFKKMIIIYAQNFNIYKIKYKSFQLSYHNLIERGRVLSDAKTKTEIK